MAEKIRAAEIICVGTELLLGDIVNTNAAYISGKLAKLGIPVYRETSVGDNPERLKAAIADAYSRVDTVIFCGGLGPTDDDLTKETVSEYFGLGLELNAEAEERIVKFFETVCRHMTVNNIKQAMIPSGATVFQNDFGTAPGIGIERTVGGEIKQAVLLPGPPSELHPLWESKVEPYLAERSNGIIVSHNIHLIGIGESAVGEMMKERMKSDNPTVAPYCNEGECRLRVSAFAPDYAKADEMSRAVVDEIKSTELGDYIYGIDCENGEKALVAELRAEKLTLAVAESCTGGLLAKRITDVPGCSDVFLGGFVTYCNDAKMKLLGVSADTLDKFDAVSAETAAEMAAGARRALGADMGLSTTGIAGPGGGTAEKPVGTVFVAVSYKDKVYVRRLRISPTKTREQIRSIAATSLFGLSMAVLGKLRASLQDLTVFNM
ncbi:MAG: competence/damage-inducible protein A [Clostridia bacterium]|nr:competence/damage-inducible protein A [Clostridia bacterium]